MVQGRDRRVELGYFLALLCRKSIFYPPKNKNSKFNNKVTEESDKPPVATMQEAKTVKASA